MNSRQFTKYIVLSVEPVLTSARPSAKMARKQHVPHRKVSASMAASLAGSETGSISGTRRARGTSVDSVSVMESVVGSIATDRKIRLAEVVIARERDFGVNDVQYTCITHLGNILREGDVVLG